MNKKLRDSLLILLGLLVLAGAIILFIVLIHKSKKPGDVRYVWQSAPAPGSVCSVPCGGGKRYLNVWCEAVDSGGKSVQQVDDKYCTGTKPANVEDCNTQACTWSEGPWGDCSATCGGGTQTRTVTCEGGDPSKCPAPVPSSTQSCNTGPCDWVTGPWSSCSVDCGVDGTETRTVSCPVPGTCSGPEPPTSQPCPDAKDCPWTYSSWGACDVPCGTGDQTRTGSCLRDGKPTDPSNCGTEGPLSQSCTSADKCEWETGAIWLPYPPSLLNLAALDGVQVKLAIEDNQYQGIVDASSGPMTQVIAPAVLSSSTTFTAKYNSAGNYLSFNISSGGVHEFTLAALVSNQVPTAEWYNILLWDIGGFGTQEAFSQLVITVANGQLTWARIPNGKTAITDIGTNIMWNAGTKVFYWGTSWPNWTIPSGSVISDLIPLPV